MKRSELQKQIQDLPYLDGYEIIHNNDGSFSLCDKFGTVQKTLKTLQGIKKAAQKISDDLLIDAANRRYHQKYTL